MRGLWRRSVVSTDVEKSNTKHDERHDEEEGVEWVEVPGDGDRERVARVWKVWKELWKDEEIVMYG